MKLSLKITLFLFLMTALFISALTIYFIAQINRNFRRQADQLLRQSIALTQQRIQLVKNQLEAEVSSLAESLFTENESILAAMLSSPPEYNAEVIGFAEKLRRRTTLDYLYVVSGSGILLSNSADPASFGKRDPIADLPLNEIVFVEETSAAVVLKKRLQFGSHAMFLRGGYFLEKKIAEMATGEEVAQPQQLRLIYREDPGIADQQQDPAVLRHTIQFKDPFGMPVAALTVSASQEDLIQQREEILKNSFYLLSASLLVCLLIGWLISFSISRPLSRLTAAAQEMSHGNFDVRVQASGNGEIGKLIQAFNTMIEQLEENRRKLVQSERIAAWQEIAKHLAHEIKNPLTPIRTSITNLRIAMEKAPDQFPEIFRESSESIIEEVEALRHLADEFARFARLPAPQPEIGQLNDVVQRAISLYRSALPPNIELEWTPGQVPPFEFDAGQLGQVVQNLLQNSIEALTGGGKILVSTFIASHNQKRWATLSVQDSGSGMTEQMKQQAFTPYFTTKPKGTGLGLAIVHRIVTEHGGNILIESEPVKGTTFEIHLPLT